MKFQVLAPLCLLVLVSGVPVQAAPKKKHPEPAVAPEPPPPVAPLERLTWFMTKNLEGILAPLTAPGFKEPQQIIELRESLADGAAKASPANKPAYQAAMQVCQALAGANDERQKAVANLSASMAVKGGSDLGARRRDHPGVLNSISEEQERADRKKAAAAADAFLATGAQNQWTERSAVLRQNIQQLYARERALERQGAAAAATPAPAAPAAPAAGN